MKIIQDIIVHSTTLNNRRKMRICQGTYQLIDDHAIFEMEQTKRWFTLNNFLPQAGFRLIPEDTQRQYVITKVDYSPTRPKKAVFTAVPDTTLKF